MNRYTLPAIKGKPYRTMLPAGAALVLEGGGTRGFYSSGVFDAFMAEGIMFPYIIGVSAGIANALSYVSGQIGRSRQIVERYAHDPRYVSARNLLRKGSMFGFDFIFNDIPQKHVFWDKEVFDAADIRFLAGAADLASGKTVWFEKNELGRNFMAVRASCSVPLISKIVKYKGYELLDGGVTDPIPIEKSIADGNTFHVIVLTRNAGFRRELLSNDLPVRVMYRRYPAFVMAMELRNANYNRQISLAERLEREGKAIIIRPEKPLEVTRTTTDPAKLLALYDEGITEGADALKKILGMY